MSWSATAGNKLFLCEHSRHGWRLRRPPEWGPDRQTIVNMRGCACPLRHGPPDARLAAFVTNLVDTVGSSGSSVFPYARRSR
ncbi:hypothetical protein CBM2634_A50079 [Cupriavidus taiwanensis]|uniref:Uncharacterized protein n=1 Tax=Cupriavidus taiwanensis TaxID=164546 RepID=A0A375J2N3_9BURK|nr:hypothetical protein CBM2634_A50079 [Cupriavidus taiwanensis]